MPLLFSMGGPVSDLGEQEITTVTRSHTPCNRLAWVPDLLWQVQLRCAFEAVALPSSHAAFDVLAVGGIDRRTQRWTVRRGSLMPTDDVDR